jgi:hypothetical protein
MDTKTDMDMNKILKYTILFTGLFSMLLTACIEVDPVVDKLEYERVFTPRQFEVRIRNRTTAEFTWTLRDDARKYVLEISEDSLLFSNIVKTAELTRDQIPYSVALEGETLYSARIKGVNDETGDSKWATITFRTDSENIFFPVADGDVGANEALLKWPAGSEVTHFIINPGNIQRQISAAEKAAGQATITGLTGTTQYTVILARDSKQRGTVSFTTLVDLGGATPVYPEDNLAEKIENAQPDDVLILFPGHHNSVQGDIQISKSITIKGYLPYDKPVLNVRFVLNQGVSNFHVKDLELAGTYGEPQTILAQTIFFNSGTYNVSSVIIEGCLIRNYNQALIYGGSAILKLENLHIDDCIMSEIVNDGGDFIDFRSGYVAGLKITNSTFNRVAAAPRDFIRLDNSSSNFPGSLSTVLIDRCTFWNVSHSRRILYVRFVSNESTVTNSIFAGPEGYTGYYSNQAATTNPVCSRNNYWNAPAFYTTSSKLDLSSDYTTLNPGFENVAAGNFKVSNQALIDNQIGDPRWLK